MAKQLKGIQAEYVFFAAYLAKSDEEAATKVNGGFLNVARPTLLADNRAGDMLQNFLGALVVSNVVSHIKRIILVTGAKQYGVHLGRPKNPLVESDRWLPEPPNPPNFYYRQQRILHAFAHTHNVQWVVTYPNDVIGHAKGNFMDLTTAIAIYAAVHRELHGAGGALPFPGSPTLYAGFDSLTSARLHARFCAWASRAPGAANEAFNVVNGDIESYSNLWPKIAQRVGLAGPGLAPLAPQRLPRQALGGVPLGEIACECRAPSRRPVLLLSVLRPQRVLPPRQPRALLPRRHPSPRSHPQETRRHLAEGVLPVPQGLSLLRAERRGRRGLVRHR